MVKKIKKTSLKIEYQPEGLERRWWDQILKDMREMGLNQEDAEYFPTGLQMAMVLSQNIQSSAQG